MALSSREEGGPREHWLSARPLPVARWTVEHWQDDGVETRSEGIVIEEPFEVRLNGRSLAVIMRTPGVDAESDRELALGFLLSEGIIADPTSVAGFGRVRDADGLPLENVLDVRLHPGETGLQGIAGDGPEAGRFERRFVVGSSCGLCGKNSIQEVCRHLPPLNPAQDGFRVRPEVLYGLPATLRQAQAVFDRTGGLHAAGLFEAEGRVLLVREDVGRHNAVDKLLGRAALDGAYPLARRILMVSGRASFEIVQKALAARIEIVAAVSAPSSLALDLAEAGGLTLIGFLRGRSMNVYTHPQRLQD